jgi:hypothetical protein
MPTSPPGPIHRSLRNPKAAPRIRKDFLVHGRLCVQVFVVVQFDQVGEQTEKFGRVGGVGWEDGFESFDFGEAVV